MRTMSRLAGDGRRGGGVRRRAARFAIMAWVFLAWPAVAPTAPAPDAPAIGLDSVVVEFEPGAGTLTVDDLWYAVSEAMRSRFYHGSIPASEATAFLPELLQQAIDRRLLALEARRRGVEPDAERLETLVARFAQRFPDAAANDPRVTELVARVRARLDEQLRAQAMERAVRASVQPDPAAARAYYAANPEKFVEPGKQRVSLILLRVDPASASAVWKAAFDQAAGLAREIGQGAGFARLAREHSDDPSAELGGDLGYLHQGMLNAEVSQLLTETEIGTLVGPLRLLEGVALFRVDERTEPRQRAFDEVAERAAQLWQREEAERVFERFMDELRTRTPAVVDETVLAEIRERLPIASN